MSSALHLALAAASSSILALAGLVACAPPSAPSASSSRPPAPPATIQAVPVAARAPSVSPLSQEEIHRVVRSNHAHLRACYEVGVRKNKKLAGNVSVKFVIEEDGVVSSAEPVEPTTLPDTTVVSCIVNEYRALRFRNPIEHQVTVVYPISYAPGD